MMEIFSSPEFYTLVMLPLMIFFVRILDVSLGTVRIIFVSRGFRYFAPVIGFFEVFIWILIIAQIFQNVTNPIYYVAYAGGFAAGTFVGIIIDSRLRIGTEMIRIITTKTAPGLEKALEAQGYHVTGTDAESTTGKIRIVYAVIDRYDLPDVVKTIKRHDPNAFYSIEDVRTASERIPSHKKHWTKTYLRYFKSKTK